MTSIGALWLPILLSAVAVFVVSSIIHMGPFWHRKDYPKIPNEDKVMDALRPLAIPPGDYMVPRCNSHAEMKTPEFLEKMQKGPVMIVTFMPTGQMGMGRPLGLWFLYIVVVSVFGAYVSGRALPAGSDYLQVFRFVGVTAFLGYAGALWQMWVWYRRSLMITITSTLDGLIYALLTAGFFGWLWPR